MKQIQSFVPIAFGLCALVGLIGAFVGLGTSSFWVDELFTAWVVGTDHNLLAAAERALTDIHPPLYYLSIFSFSQIFGESDIVLRAFSAVTAVASILVLVFACQSSFSLNARCFAAALATSSIFWFYQAQNARSNSLGMFESAIIMALGLTLLQSSKGLAQRPVATAAFLIVAFIGAFTHFYVGYVALAAILSIAVLRPDYRMVMGASAAALLVAMGAYVKMVAQPHGEWLIGTSWMRADLRWYLGNLHSALSATSDPFALVALMLCTGLMIFGLFKSGALSRQQLHDHLQLLLRAPLTALREADQSALFLFLTPTIVLGGAVVSSALLAPNFTDRNFLLVSPFLWGLAAKIYDSAFQRCPERLRPFANTALFALLVTSCTIVLTRSYSRNMQYREAARWISRSEGCSGQLIPILVDVSVNAVEITKPGFLERIIPATRARYLPSSPTRLFRVNQDAPVELKEMLRQRVAQGRCAILGWSADPEPRARANEIASILVEQTGALAERARVKYFPTPKFNRFGQPSVGDNGIFVIYIAKNDNSYGAWRQ